MSAPAKRALLAALFVVVATAIFVVVKSKSAEKDARREAESARLAVGQSREQAAADLAARRGEQASISARLEASEARVRDLERDLHAARARSAQLLIEKSEAEAAAVVARSELAEARSTASAKPALPPAAAPEAPPPEPKRAPLLEPKPTALGPTAVTDPGQVKKLVDGLNSLLAGAEEPESWSVTSAEAVDGDRLVRAVVEARARGGGLSRSFRAEEVRFALVPSSRSLEVRFREGAVTYPGERTIAFPGGRYAAVLAVDPTAFRNAAHPLVAVPSQ